MKQLQNHEYTNHNQQYEKLTLNVNYYIFVLEKDVIGMTVYETIFGRFSPDEPILIEDIQGLFPGKSRPWIDKVIRTMVDEGLIKRFSNGIYYIPRKTIFGDSILSTDKVISKKYLSND